MVVTSMKRRQGQGMTEYIILVGLIAVLMVFAIRRYKDQVQVTIEGTGDRVGDLANNMGGDPITGTGPGGRSGTYVGAGVTDDGTFIYKSTDPADTNTYKRDASGNFVVH